MESGTLKKGKYFSTVILLLFLLLVSGGIVNAAAELRLSVSASPSSLPAFYLQDNTESIDLDVSIHRSRNIVISKLMQGEVDAALLSTNEAAKLYNRDIEVQLLGIHNWGLFYLLSSKEEIESWEDLRGEKIYVPDKGGPLDIVFQELAAKKEIDFKTELQVERGKMREVAQLMINEMAETAVIREPFVSQTLLNNPQSRIVFDLQQEWEKEYDFRIAQSALVVRKDFAENNKELIAKLEEQYLNSVKKLAEDNQLAAELGLKYLEVKPEVTLKAYPSLNLDYQKIADVKEEVIAYLEVLKSYNPETIGGSLPDAEFYFSY
ncbi:MAG: ABC transporter substrate-binding protein [Halanaerobium sp.]